MSPQAAIDSTRIVVECGHCHRRFRVPGKWLGRRARCRVCRNLFRMVPHKTLDDTVLDWLMPDEGAA